jgi:hypothetical protein
MELSWKTVFLVLLTCAVTARAEDPEALIPGRFMPKGDGQPIWVSAREALSADGSVRQGVLHELQLRDLHSRRDRLLARRQRGISTEVDSTCDVQFIGYTSQGDGFDPNVKTFAELRDLAATRPVIRGTVIASAVGIHFGMPHTVLRVDTPSAGVVHLLYPHGRIRMNGMMVCNEDPYYSEVPSIGDAITVVLPQPFDEMETLYWPPGSSIFYEHEGGVVAAPYLRNDPAIQQFKSLAQLTPALLGAEKPRESHRR